MEKNRSSKIVALIALVIAVVGITLGFAAFSNTLTISSSASVKPNADEFKLMIYGLTDSSELSNIVSGQSPDFSKWSTTSIMPADYSNGVEASDAIVNNTDFTISNIAVDFVEPATYAKYIFAIKNEGEYDAYMDFSSYGTSVIGKTCTAGEGTTQTLVDEACEEMFLGGELFDSSFQSINITGSYKIAVGDYLYIRLDVRYIGSDSTARADGPFSVKFDDIKVDFSTAA